MHLRVIFTILAVAIALTIAGCAAPHHLVSMTIIPGEASLGNPGETSQYIAIGTFSSTPKTVDITNQVTWSSSDVGVATVDSAGLATAGLVVGETTITAIGPSAPTITATSSLVTLGGGAGHLPTLAIYAVGLGSGTVTSSPAGVDCVSGAGCTGTFPLNTVVTLTESPSRGSQFGGWSSNCTPVPPSNPTATTCTITMSGNPLNEAVGAIFNP